MVAIGLGNKSRSLSQILSNIYVPNLINPSRGAYILKRRYPTRLHRLEEPPKALLTRDFIYDLVRDTYHEKKPNIKVILTTYVEGVGRAGEQVEVRPFAGYRDLILPGLAVYVTEENIAKYSSKVDELTTYSSKYSFRTIQLLQKLVLNVEMNMTQPWTIEPWHLRVALRKAGFVVPEETISLNRKITGPYPEQQNKEFYFTVTINNHEKVKVRGRIHLWCLNEEERPGRLENWIKGEPLFEEDRTVLEGMPLPVRPSKERTILGQ